MRLLMLGGTGFVGRAIVAEALTRGLSVTVFNRGRSEAPAGVASLRGDRTDPAGLAALDTGTWDLVVDPWTGAPSAVLATARLLAGRVGHYTYISSRSVYTYPPAPNLDEAGPVVEAEPDDGDVDYARAKRGGELAAGAVFGDAALLVRAGLILGPYEDVGRLPYWLRRIARGGPVPAPGPRELALQYIDARDLAQWTLDAAAAGRGGAYNVVSPPGHTSMGGLLDACVAVTGSDARLRWVEPDAILAAGVQPWTELPIWLPPGPDHDGMHGSNVAKALAAGLRCRPAVDTVADTWAWLQGIGGAPRQRPDRPTVGLSEAQEAALLAAAG